MINQSNITLNLTLEEVNKILSALGSQPYAEVYEIVSKIQQQAQGQMAPQAESGAHPKED